MRGLVAALGLTVVLAGSAGCQSRWDVPADLEPVYDFIQYHGPACEVYPYSCPCCPYFDYQSGVWRDPITGRVVMPQAQ